MPRVSDQHLAARRQQIIDAARACFTRNGFHATTMQDVIKEAGLSVGAVYRYFKSKEELIAAIVGEVVDEITGRLHEVTSARPRLSVKDTLAAALGVMEPALGPDGMFRVALQVWSESLTNPSLRTLVTDLYARLRAEFREYAAELPLPDGVTADELSGVLLSLAQGYALQRVLTGGPSPTEYVAGIGGLTRLNLP
ncbi:TetR/AcrR family transcriptional regulator [Hamadaea sp. NPDC050747]|uniref:TetR/AcrR family transcriptional regulator n=1 Tax=Hamadaea sp. NPDC050747 TaxID=3155789 RepID=UPI0033FF08C0